MGCLGNRHERLLPWHRSGGLSMPSWKQDEVPMTPVEVASILATHWVRHKDCNRAYFGLPIAVTISRNTCYIEVGSDMQIGSGDGLHYGAYSFGSIRNLVYAPTPDTPESEWKRFVKPGEAYECP